ncbi:MAG TPA: restriction endonuclease subunit R [Gammaproteobacteria bacterium]|nr:restriction endonuclease subunit R [Gammaproteobacteria bacterium]
MSHLHEVLAEQVSQWRTSGYPTEKYSVIAEILQFAWEGDEHPQLRFLRKAQFQALESYWYLRLVLGTPTIPQLYEKLFPTLKERLKAMGVSAELFEEADYDFEALLSRVKTDNAFVRRHKLESLRETLTLDYPSYILALAMGAGKTILMGTIVATEFAMAQEYPDGPFVQNALIFAPGKTIIESLREIADIPFDKVLPAHLFSPFAATLKLTFTRDGDKELPVVWGSSWNIIVTNTEKIRIQKKTARKKTPQLALQLTGEPDHDAEIANLRLQAIASLPHLAIFSDEAHHTYGQKLLGKWQKDKQTGEPVFVEQGIKKVRRTVDYLAEATNLIAVVNTTGTPYFERQPLRDVVIWYGLGEGISDGVLKELANNIHVFDLDENEAGHLVERIVTDFVDDYWPVSLPDGSPARLALYFPNTEALDELRPRVDSALALKGISASVVLPVHSKSSEQVRTEFYRVASDPDSPYRIILLVNMGTEGWNCPSLFACGLVRKLKSSNNFVLQAATRCLRQVPGNTKPARVYVSKGNKPILAKQLEETFGTSIGELNERSTERVEKTIELRSPNLPPLILRRRFRRFRRAEANAHDSPIGLTMPEDAAPKSGHMETWTMAQPKAGKARLTRVDGGEDNFIIEPLEYSLYGAAAELAANSHLPMPELIAALRKLYGKQGRVPEYHLPALAQQIEAQRSVYEEYWEEIDVALALVKPEGFECTVKEDVPVYTARVSFAKEREHLYKTADEYPDTGQARALSFHYEGYNFDSGPESEYLERVLYLLKQYPEQVEGIWFTGGLTDPGKTELFAEYLGEDKRWHRYTPDFVLRRKDGKHLIVEVKKDALSAPIREDLRRHERGQGPVSIEGRKAVALKRWEELNPDTLHYQVIFADGTLAQDALDTTREFILGSA